MHEMTLGEHWRWFKTLKLKRCRRPGCWEKRGFNLPGICDAHYGEIWAKPEIQEWIETLEPVTIDVDRWRPRV